MIVDLVQTQARDGVRLDGIFQAPERRDPAYPADAVCFIHGTGGNFYSSSLFDAFAAHVLGRGAAVLRVNTRGHDGISTAVTPTGGRRQGAAFEAVDDCRLDVAAWVDWLQKHAGPRVGLVGHSLGAVKCLYALTSPGGPTATFMIAVSPPRLSYSWFCNSPQGPGFLETYQTAERLVGQGQPAALLDVKMPLPFVITAAGYVEKYDPDERFNFLKFIGGVSCPTLVTFGGDEVARNVAFQHAPEELRELSQRRPRLAVAVVPDADHFYTGARSQLLDVVDGWMRLLSTHA